MTISQSEYAQRRQQLITQLKPNSIALIQAAPELIRNGDTQYAYRQHSDFYYLTGLAEADAIAVLLSGNTANHYILFNLARDPKIEQWVGPRVGQQGAVTDYGAQQAFAIEEFDEQLAHLLTHCEHIYLSLKQNNKLLRRVLRTLKKVQYSAKTTITTPQNVSNLDPFIHELRLFKSPAEVDLMRRAATISAQAHCLAMQACKPGLYEYQLEAEVLRECVWQGSRAMSYPSIVASGGNACTLHYVANEDVLRDGELVLIDAGCEYQYYAADISRTFPVNGRFSQNQRSLYEIVLQAALAGIAAVKPGNTWDMPERAIIQILTTGLCELGLLSGNVDELIQQKAYQRFYMHSYGHWLGLDGHDAGCYRDGNNWRVFEPGMVTTVEPGLYISPANDIDPKWWNIGIRIEDDILVTVQGNEVLSAAVPKTIAEIEVLMKKS